VVGAMSVITVYFHFINPFSNIYLYPELAWPGMKFVFQTFILEENGEIIHPTFRNRYLIITSHKGGEN
jgi:hypothetical protein